MTTTIQCRSKCCSMICHDINNSALWVNTLRALWHNCPQEPTYLDGTKKEVKK